MKPSINWLSAFIPMAAWLHFGTGFHTATFFVSCLAIIPVAGWMGQATEHLAEHTGEGIGGLLNATFGNAAELVIALVALSKGMEEVVKASITGSIIGNVLLVLGASFVAGGIKHKTQTFNSRGARTYSTMLFLAAAALVLPAVFHATGGPDLSKREQDLSLEISITLLLTYIAALYFSLKTHRQLFTAPAAESSQIQTKADHSETWTIRKSLAVLAGATVCVAIIAEWMIGSVELAAQSLGMSHVFVGVVIVAIVGNAAEHSTALVVAMKNRMDLAIGVAVGSSIQIALFVAPVLVMASYWIGPKPINLVFSIPEVLAVVLAVLVTEQVTADGESNWFEGVQLLSVYTIIAMLFFWL